MGSSEYGGRRVIQKLNVDRISNLPDELLSHILSRLPAKWAVQTSILSKRWEKIWTSITCLDFKNHTSSLGNNNDVEFSNFVGHVFRSCNPKNIQKLILHLPRSGANESSVITWIDEWIKHKVSEADLYVSNLPLSVFSWTTLTHLTLGDCVHYDAEGVSFNLPFLKVLCINGRFSPLMEKLISDCPVLEDLTLGASSGWYMTDTFMVSAHTLKTLRLQLIRYSFYSCLGKISVEAPNLEYLHLSESFVTYNTKGNFSSLVKAYVNIGNNSMRHRFKYLPRSFALPNFASLTCLEVISCDNRFWVMLPKFIRSTPSLEILSLEQKDGHDNVIDESDDEYDNVMDDEYDWVEPKSVPKCVGHHIGVIKIEGFKGRKHELQLIKYFLGRAKVLKTLTVRCQGAKHEEEIKFVGKLLEFSRASKDCRVKFHGNVISNL